VIFLQQHSIAAQTVGLVATVAVAVEVDAAVAVVEQADLVAAVPAAATAFAVAVIVVQDVFGSHPSVLLL
jgi:dienelactone hydrolase